MAARLIVNADDFGLTRGVNRAVGELFAAGVVSSATLMANGAAFEDAVAVAREHPGLGVGCHVVLVDGVPLAPRDRIPGLLGQDGRTLRPSLADFALALLRGKITAAEIELEALCQIRRLQEAGVRITHLDTHKHTHAFPAVSRRLLVLAEREGIAAVRNPFEPEWVLGLGQGSGPRRLAVRGMGWMRGGFAANLRRQGGRVRSTAGTAGISATGALDGASLREVLEAVPEEGAWELCCHPGYRDGELDGVKTRLRAERDVERGALLREVPGWLAGGGGRELVGYEVFGDEE